jgi:hypothetical protein
MPGREPLICWEKIAAVMAWRRYALDHLRDYATLNSCKGHHTDLPKTRGRDRLSDHAIEAQYSVIQPSDGRANAARTPVSASRASHSADRTSRLELLDAATVILPPARKVGLIAQ